MKEQHSHNGQQLPKNSADNKQFSSRVERTFSINVEIWKDFYQVSTRWYRSRKKHPERPSYAKLVDDAIDVALRDYVTKMRILGETERPAN